MALTDAEKNRLKKVGLEVLIKLSELLTTQLKKLWLQFVMAIGLRLFALRRKAWGITIALKLVKVLKLDMLKILKKVKRLQLIGLTKFFGQVKVVAKNDHLKVKNKPLVLNENEHNGNK